MRELQPFPDLNVFIHDDASIVNSVDGPVSNTGNPGQLNFLRVGVSNNDDERICVLKINLPHLNDAKIDEIQLCMYQYFSDSGASSSDKFSLHSFSEDWNETDSTYPGQEDIIANNFEFSSTEEGKQCINIEEAYFDTFLDSSGVILTANTSGSRKERYFMSSEYTSAMKNIYEPAVDLTYHPHWRISFQSSQELPTARPDSSTDPHSPIVTDSDTTGGNQSSVSPRTSGTTTMIGIFLFVTFFALLISLIVFVRRKRHADRERIFRTFLTDEGIIRRGKYSFNSVNSSNRAESGNSGRGSLRWIENVQLDDGGGDKTVCNKIDERIDNAVIFPPVVKPMVATSTTPRQKNPGMIYDHPPKSSNNLRSRNTPPQHRHTVHQGLKQNDKKSSDIRKKRFNVPQSMPRSAAEQENIQRVREQIHARKMRMLMSRMQAHDSNSASNNEFSYPSLISSYPSSSDDDSTYQRDQKPEENCFDEVLNEIHATKKDAKCIWEENFGDPKSSTLGSSTNPSSTTASSTIRYTSSGESTISYPQQDSETGADSQLFSDSRFSGKEKYASSYYRSW